MNSRTDDLSRYRIPGIFPFNQVWYQSCFYSAVFPVVAKHCQSVLPILYSDIWHYDQGDDRPGNLGYVPAGLPLSELLADIGIRMRGEHPQDVTGALIEHIGRDEPVVLFLDSFYQSMRQDTYQRYHQPHAILHYGYDRVRREFHIIEHDYINSLLFRENTIPFADSCKGNEAYARDNGQNGFLVFTFLSSACGKDYRRLYRARFRRLSAEVATGIDALRRFRLWLEKIVECPETLRPYTLQLMEQFNTIINGLRSAKYLHHLLGFSSECGDMYDGQVNDWSLLRSLLGKFQFNGFHSPASFQKAVGRLDRIILREETLLRRQGEMMA